MSSSWIAIDHPFVACPPSAPFCNPFGSIVQAGFIKCSTSIECALSHIPPEYFYRNVTFFAIGNANDIFNTPSPWPMSPPGVFEDGSYTFKLVLHYNSDGTRDWWTYINGALYFIYTDMARNWLRDTVQTANEIWNVGDGLGGIAGLHQDFTAISWGNGTNHSGLASQPGLTGHCYPWAGFNPNPAPPATYHVFTNNNHTGATC
jgi:hypothetical protein